MVESTDPVGPTLRPVPDAERILAFIEEEIAALRLEPGGRLPTERTLAERTGRSRSAVRRALATMEADGRVVRQVGRGTFLLRRAAEAFPTGASAATSPAEVIAVRLLFEPQLMPLAVMAATVEDLEEMHRCLEGGEGAETYDDFERWDTALHRSFAAATHNGLVCQIAALLGATREDPLWGGLKRRSSSPARRAAARDDHRAIVAALAERDAAAAQARMRTHLLRVRAHLLGEADLTAGV
ncbi:MAG TPA: FCD domain-containing protein [Acidimicrobiales bacterium]|jgi:DNA-binding FadR family transcriptional regulator|nr:FCD domain-containing protein [Acidimicrobiales bacterium]